MKKLIAIKLLTVENRAGSSFRTSFPQPLTMRLAVLCLQNCLLLLAPAPLALTSLEACLEEVSITSSQHAFYTGCI